MIILRLPSCWRYWLLPLINGLSALRALNLQGMQITKLTNSGKALAGGDFAGRPLHRLRAG